MRFSILNLSDLHCDVADAASHTRRGAGCRSGCDERCEHGFGRASEILAGERTRVRVDPWLLNP